MATRSKTTFQKRQKEMARAEKQRDKAARRLQRRFNVAITSKSSGRAYWCRSRDFGPHPFPAILVPCVPGDFGPMRKNLPFGMKLRYCKMCSPHAVHIADRSTLEA